MIAQGVMGLLAKGLPVTGGAILLEGEDITHATQHRLRELRCTRMSMVFQEPMTALNPVMTCGNQIDEVLLFHAEMILSERKRKTLDILREVSLPDPESGVRIKAFVSCHDGKRPSVIELKAFCGDNLPAYMVPDVFSFQETLPKTSTDKIDYQRLKALG